ncbi:MAG: zinc ribbon domain-containing protein [Candidatus Hodarchaeota archaeon]
MGIARILGSSLLMIILANILVYFLLSDVVFQVYQQMYPTEGEVGVLTAILNTVLMPFETQVPMKLSIILFAGFVGGAIARGKGSIGVGISAGFVLALFTVFLISRYMPGVWSSLTSNSLWDPILIYLGKGLVFAGISTIACVTGGVITRKRSLTLIYPSGEEEPPEIGVKCPHCGSEYSSNPLYCGHCGEIIEEQP